MFYFLQSSLHLDHPRPHVVDLAARFRDREGEDLGMIDAIRQLSELLDHTIQGLGLLLGEAIGPFFPKGLSVQRFVDQRSPLDF